MRDAPVESPSAHSARVLAGEAGQVQSLLVGRTREGLPEVRVQMQLPGMGTLRIEMARVARGVVSIRFPGVADPNELAPLLSELGKELRIRGIRLESDEPEVVLTDGYETGGSGQRSGGRGGRERQAHRGEGPLAPAERTTGSGDALGLVAGLLSQVLRRRLKGQESRPGNGPR